MSGTRKQKRRQRRRRQGFIVVTNSDCLISSPRAVAQMEKARKRRWLGRDEDLRWMQPLYR